MITAKELKIKQLKHRISSDNLQAMQDAVDNNLLKHIWTFETLAIHPNEMSSIRDLLWALGYNVRGIDRGAKPNTYIFSFEIED